MRRNKRTRLARERELTRVVQVFLKFFSIELLAGLLILVVAQVWTLLKVGEWGTLNWRIAIRAMLTPLQGPDRVAMIQIDERSAREWPTREMVPRDYLANLIQKVEEAKPRVVALDVFLGSPGPDLQADSLLSGVLSHYSNLVLGSEVEPEAGSDRYIEYRPYERFLSLVPRQGVPVIGHTMLAVKKGLAYGRLPIVRTHEHGLCPSFALAIYLRSLGLSDDGAVRSRLREWAEGSKRSNVAVSIGKVLKLGLLHRVLPINFIGKPEQTFRRTYPAYAVLNMDKDILRLALADKIVLIGATYRHARDKLFTPVALRAPMDGVEVHANILANYLLNDHVFPVNPLLRWGSVLLAIAVTVLLFRRFLFLRAIFLLALFLVTFWVIAFAAFVIGDPNWIPVVEPTLFSVGAALFLIFYRSMRVELANDEIEKLWGPRLADSHILELEEQTVTSERLVTAAQGQLETVTIIYLRLHGLLDLLEERGFDERKLMRMIDQFIDVIQEEVVFAERHRGAADRFFGEAMFIFCGVPLAEDDREEAIKAVQIAFDAREHYKLLLQSWRRATEHDFHFLRLGIAVHTGPVVVGAIHNRTGEKEYAIIGETLHVLEELEKFSGPDSRILISESTAKLVSDVFRLARIVPQKYQTANQLKRNMNIFGLVGPKYDSIEDVG